MLFRSITGFLLSIYVGQFPWSNDTLIDVKTRAYAMQGDATRAIGTSENALFHRVVTSIRSEGIQSSELTIPFRDCRILATGRLASHFLGAKDLETVGQYWQRANDYQRLDPSLASPLLRYDLIVIDPYEAFQQTTEESVRVLREATSLGFQATSHEGQLVVLTRTK